MTYKFPKELGACADKYYTLRQKRAEAQKVVDAIEAEEKALKEYLIENLPKSLASGVAGKLCRVSVNSRDVPTAKDWAKVFAHIKKTGDFDILQRRLSDGAIKERWEANKKIPGIEPFKVTSLSVNKL